MNMGVGNGICIAWSRKNDRRIDMMSFFQFSISKAFLPIQSIFYQASYSNFVH